MDYLNFAIVTLTSLLVCKFDFFPNDELVPEQTVEKTGYWGWFLLIGFSKRQDENCFQMASYF